MPVHLTIAHTITDQINLLASHGNPSEMEMRRVKREIEQVKNADIAQYYMLLGMFYSVVGNEAESRSNHERSLRLSSDIIFLENYAFSLKRLDAVAEALGLLLRAFDQAPTLEVLEEVTHAMIYAGDFSDFERVIQRFEKTHPGRTAGESYSAGYIQTVLDRLARAKVTIEDFKLSMALVKAILSRKGFTNSIETMTFSHGTFDEVPHVDVVVKVKASSSESLFEINEEIAEAMACAEHIEAWNRLVFTVCDHIDTEHSEVA